MIQNIDVAPTVLEVAGLQLPKHFHGRSILPLLQGKEVVWRDKIFYEYYWEFDFPQNIIGSLIFRKHPPCMVCVPTGIS